MIIKISSTPAILWRDCTIKNVVDCNYEIYLTEFINESKEFMKLTGGKKIRYCEKQANGESDSYLENNDFLDYKLLCSQSMQEVIGITTYKLVWNHNSYDIEFSEWPEKINYGYWLHSLFYSDSINDIKAIDDGINRCKDTGVFRDKKKVIDKIKTDKDCLYLYSEFFWSPDEISREEIIDAAIIYFEKWLKSLFMYRDKIRETRHTYLAFMIPQFKEIVFCRWDKESNKINLFDIVQFEKSNNFMKYLKIMPPNEKFIWLYIGNNKE